MKNSLKNYEKQKLKSKNATDRRVLHLLNENIFRKRRPNNVKTLKNTLRCLINGGVKINGGRGKRFFLNLTNGGRGGLK